MSRSSKSYTQRRFLSASPETHNYVDTEYIAVNVESFGYFSGGQIVIHNGNETVCIDLYSPNAEAAARNLEKINTLIETLTETQKICEEYYSTIPPQSEDTLPWEP